MAKTKVGSPASWAGKHIEDLTGTDALTKADSGKTFICAGTFIVNLPSAADAGAGWTARFIWKSGIATVNSVNVGSNGEFLDLVCDGTTFHNAGTAGFH